MSGKVVIEKYGDPDSPVMTVKISNLPIENTLTDLGVVLNVMTKETMETLGLLGLRSAPTVLQFADHSTIKPEGVVEYIIFSINSWEYPTDFIIP